MFGNNPYQKRTQSLSFEERIKRFFRDYTLLAVLMVVTAVVFFYIKSGLFYGLFYLFVLYFGGIFFCQYHKKNQIIWIWLAGVIVGYFFYWLIQFPTIPDNPSISHIAAMAASGAFAVLIAQMTSVPDLKMRVLMISAIKVKYVVLGLVVIDLLMSDVEGKGTHLSHLGGMITGFLWVFFTAQRFREHIFTPLFSKVRKKKKPRFSEQFETIRNEDKRAVSDEEYNKVRSNLQGKIDEILEKISKSGYDSLTKDEKELLFKQSNE